MDVSDLMRRMIKEALAQFEGRPVRDLLVEATRSGERPKVKARLSRVIDQSLDVPRLQSRAEERALVHEIIDADLLRHIREEMERAEARRRADDLAARLERRLEQLDLEAHVSPLTPVAGGKFVVVPAGLLAKMRGGSLPVEVTAEDTQASAARARAIVMGVERSLGYHSLDRERDQLGYDIESRDPRTGCLRFIEVKGGMSGANTISATRNEILTSLN